ncbi:MAG: roadblock/LC7 domain-containing protein [Thermoplasmatota archaeon]
MTEKEKRLQEALDKLAAQPGLHGALLISRDGFPLIGRSPRLPNPETFSAMSAALLGAAEASINEIGGGETRRVLIETRTDRLIAIGLTDELLLVVLGAASHPLEKAFAVVEAAATDLAKLVAG